MNNLLIYRVAIGGYWVCWAKSDRLYWFEVDRDVYDNYVRGLRPRCCVGMEDNRDRSMLFWCAVVSCAFSTVIAGFVLGVVP